MASSQEEYSEELRLLQERFPEESKDKLLRQLQKHNGDYYLVRASLIEKEFREKKLDALESRYGATLTAFQQQYPSAHPLKRACLLKLLGRFSGDVGLLRKYLEHIEEKENADQIDIQTSRRQQQEDLKTKYASQLAELATAGINVNCPSVLARLEKSHGDVDKVVEMMKRQQEKKGEINQLTTKYANQVAQLEADGIKIKNKRLLIQLLEKANGQIDVVKQILAEKEGQKHPITDEVVNETVSSSKETNEINEDDLDYLKQLREAGIHGNPMKILKVFHECNQSIEMTKVRLEKEQKQREHYTEKCQQERILLAESQDAYLTINNRDDWPQHIEQVYLDGNNMMFVVDSLRRLCLSRQGRKTEHAIAQIASAWNQHMHISHIDLIFDSTNQIGQLDNDVGVSSAQPTYKTTDDMLIDIARRSENREKNRHTIVVTSDRALSIHLKREGYLIVKSYNWFAHCVMVLAPDLIQLEQTMHNASSTSTIKTRYNFDELVHRIAKIDL